MIDFNALFSADTPTSQTVLPGGVSAAGNATPTPASSPEAIVNGLNEPQRQAVEHEF